MQQKTTFRLAFLIGILAVVAPVLGALYVAQRDALTAEYARVDGYARDVMARSDATAEQADEGITRLLALGAPACADQELVLMREIDLGSSYIQTIGRVRDDAVICSSLGIHEPAMELGPATLLTLRKVLVRTNVRFSFAADATFLVLERDGFAAVIHKALPIDATTEDASVSLATFSTPSGTILTSRGHVDPAWLSKPLSGSHTHFVDGDRIVSMIGSGRFHAGAVAAVEDATLRQRVRSSALDLLPMGLVAGLVMAGLIFYLARVQTAMPAMIRAALRRDELSVQYQPVVELGTGKWIGAEALVRWKRANGEWVRPDVFIPVAEESGLIQQVTERVLSLVGADLGRLAALGLDVQVSINLSSADLQSPATVALLQRTLQEAGVAAQHLHVEATERGFMNTEIARKVLADIRALGVKVAIDDFGTGYSSLSYLGSFELDYLKIDKSFVDTVGSDAATSQVVPHIIEIAKSLNLTMIAEGVETEPQAAFLRERGVQLAQGWLFSRALAFPAFVEGLTANRATNR